MSGRSGNKKPMGRLSNRTEESIKADFRVFLTLLWREMNLPAPTPMQLLFASTLQHCKARRVALLGFRGFAKTYITAAFIVWCLYCNPQLKTVIWGSTEASASDTTFMALRWVQNIPWLQHLAPTGDMAQSKGAFDVQGRGMFRGESCSAYGIGGAITGTRADLLVVDDPETSTNGGTAAKRLSLQRGMDEAVNVITLGGRIVVLGTLHFDDSIYLRLLNQGYQLYLFPMAVPAKEVQEQCWDYYLPPVKRMIEALPVGAPLDRFNEEELEIKRSQGVVQFERQCLVNPFRSSFAQKPFNLSKIIIFDADIEKLPIKFLHAQNADYLDTQAMDFSSAALTDKLYRPYQWSDECAPYDRKIMYIDPAGKGKDELSINVVGAANGYAVLFHTSGLVGGSEEGNLQRIIEVARRFKVDCIYVEDNFGNGMFADLLRAYYFREYARLCSETGLIPIVGHRQNKNKEQRIVASVDPVINFSRLIMTHDALTSDWESANIHTSEDRMVFRLTYQLSYFSPNTEGKLEHDDRIDGLASALSILKGFLTEHPADKADTWEDNLMKELFEKDNQQFIPEESKVKPITSRRTFMGLSKGTGT